MGSRMRIISRSSRVNSTRCAAEFGSWDEVLWIVNSDLALVAFLILILTVRGNRSSGHIASLPRLSGQNSSMQPLHDAIVYLLQDSVYM